MSENGMCVKVALRIRPLVESEVSKGYTPCIEIVPNEPQVNVRGNRAFTYDFVFGPDDSQERFYNTAVKDLVLKVFKGYNVTILAYGQTGSGKTYSMGTAYTGTEDMGIIPRAVNDIFQQIDTMKEWDFKITVAFMELYKEQLYDLLAPNRCIVDIREDAKCIRIPGLTEVPVHCASDTIKCLVQGSSGRAVGATAMNAQSSRSHAIFTITIQQQKLDDNNSSTTAKFHLVDLAGSERSKKTQATGERFKEGVNINRGLLALGNVISALGDENNQKGYISYRDSKLTRLLQDSLGGNSMTLMIACVSPADYNLEETLSTLRYADRTKRIKNKPIVNQDPKSAEIARLKQTVHELQLELLSSGKGVNICPPEHQELAEQVKTLMKKNRMLTEELSKAISSTTNMYEKALMAELARDRISLKLTELQAEYGVAMDSLSQTMQQENCPANFLDQLKCLKDVQEKIKELQAEQKATNEQILNHELSSATTSMIKAEPAAEYENNLPIQHQEIDEKHQSHTLQQLERNKELEELNQQLALKEDLASRLMANMKHMTNFKLDYDTNIKEMEEQIATLQKEKEELLKALSSQNSTSCNKLSEQRKKQLQELEQKIASLQKKITEQAKIIKMKEKNDEKIKQLDEEIRSMKQAKVRLIRQMRTENEQFRIWKQERERELIKLRTQDRKRQNEMARMEILHTKQQNVLKRKVEEAAAVNKRLKDALALQKTAQDRRAQHGSTTKMQTWIDQELEVLVSTVDAERTLEQLMEDRALLNERLNELKTQLEGAVSEEERQMLKENVKQFEEDLELRNVQIADLQQKIVDSDQENKAKTRWETIQSMVEAKCALKYLFNLAAEMKRDASNKMHTITELQEACQRAENKVQHYENKLRENSDHHRQEVIQLEKEHEAKVLVLLKQLHEIEKQGNEDGCLKIQAEELEKLEELRNELDRKNKEIEDLRSQLVLEKTPAPVRSSRFMERNNDIYVDPTVVFESSTEEDLDDESNDPDWRKTPMFKRLQKLKATSFLVSTEQKGIKRTSDGKVRCSCKRSCRTNQCGCRKAGAKCSRGCKCNHETCENFDQENAGSINSDERNTTDSDDENKDPEENFKRPRNISPLREIGPRRKLKKYFGDD